VFDLALDREDASSMVTAGATANTTEGNSRASRESGLLCSHSQTVYNTKGTRAHTHRELIRKWLWAGNLTDSLYRRNFLQPALGFSDEPRRRSLRDHERFSVHSRAVHSHAQRRRRRGRRRRRWGWPWLVRCEALYIERHMTIHIYIYIYIYVYIYIYIYIYE